MDRSWMYIPMGNGALGAFGFQPYAMARETVLLPGVARGVMKNGRRHFFDCWYRL